MRTCATTRRTTPQARTHARTLGRSSPNTTGKCAMFWLLMAGASCGGARGAPPSERGLGLRGAPGLPPTSAKQLAERRSRFRESVPEIKPSDPLMHGHTSMRGWGDSGWLWLHSWARAPHLAARGKFSERRQKYVWEQLHAFAEMLPCGVCGAEFRAKLEAAGRDHFSSRANLIAFVLWAHFHADMAEARLGVGIDEFQRIVSDALKRHQRLFYPYAPRPGSRAALAAERLAKKGGPSREPERGAESVQRGAPNAAPSS